MQFTRSVGQGTSSYGACNNKICSQSAWLTHSFNTHTPTPGPATRPRLQQCVRKHFPILSYLIQRKTTLKQLIIFINVWNWRSSLAWSRQTVLINIHQGTYCTPHLYSTSVLHICTPLLLAYMFIRTILYIKDDSMFPYSLGNSSSKGQNEN